MKYRFLARKINDWQMISPIKDLGAVKIRCKKDFLVFTGAFYMYILCILVRSNMTVSPYAD